MLPARELSVGAFRIRDMRYAAVRRHARHAHDQLQISVILAGTMEEEVAGHTNRASAGDVIVKPAGVAHANAFSATRIISIDADPGSTGLPLDGYAMHRLDASVTSGLRVARHFLRGGMLEESVTELLASLTTRRFRDHKAALRAASMLEESYRRDIRIRDLAAEAGLHPVHLARLFRERWGCTPRDYLQRLRARAAIRRITSTDDSLANVALDSGFCDQAHMTRVVSRFAGLPPSVLRKLAAN